MRNEPLEQFLIRVAEDARVRRALGPGSLTTTRVVDLANALGLGITAADLAAADLPLNPGARREAERSYAPRSADPDTCIVFLEECFMSKEPIAALFRKAADDPAFRRKLAEFAANEGFPMDADQLDAADLDRVAGGLIKNPQFGPGPVF